MWDTNFSWKYEEFAGYLPKDILQKTTAIKLLDEDDAEDQLS